MFTGLLLTWSMPRAKQDGDARKVQDSDQYLYETRTSTMHVVYSYLVGYTW